jgi:hypothetical protein
MESTKQEARYANGTDIKANEGWKKISLRGEAPGRIDETKKPSWPERHTISRNSFSTAGIILSFLSRVDSQRTTMSCSKQGQSIFQRGQMA